METNQTEKRKKMNVHAVHVEEGIQRFNKKIRYVKENIFIGTCIRMKALGGTKTDYRILKLDRVEGRHYIFVSEYGWVEAYTLNQLCFEIANGNITIVKGDKKHDKK